MTGGRTSVLFVICVALSRGVAIAQPSGTAPRRPTGVAGAVIAQLRELRAYPHLDRAYRLVSSNRLLEARTEFERHLTIDPAGVQPRIAYVMLLFRLKAYPEVVRQADLIVAEQPRAPQAWLYRGMGRQALGDDDAALADFQTAARLEGISRADRQYALSAAADVALSRHHYTAANQALEALATLHSDYRLFFRQGLALEGLGRFDAAETAYRRSLTLSSNIDERLAAYRALAALARRTNQWTAERAALILALELAPRQFDIIQALVDGAWAAHDYRDQARWLRLAIAQRPSTELRFALATSLSMAGDHASAAAAFEAAGGEAASRDDRHRAWTGAAQAYTNLNRHNVASTMYRRAVEVKRDAATLAALALACERAGRLNEASSAWRAARQLSESPEYAAHAGMVESRLGKVDTAVRDLTAAASGALSANVRGRVLRQLGYLHRGAGRLADAAEAFKEALATGGADPQIHLALGEICMALDESAAAIQYLTLAAPVLNTPTAWRLLAASYAAAGETAHAVEIYHWAYKRSRGEWALVMHSADALMVARRWAEAEADLRLVLTHENLPASVRGEALERLGMAYWSQENTTAAIDTLQQAIALGRVNARTWQYLGFALFKAERWQEALDAFHASFGKDGSARTLVSMARCYERLGKTGLALHAVHRAIAQDADLSMEERIDLLKSGGYLRANEGDLGGAVEMWGQAMKGAFDVDTATRLAGTYRSLGRSGESERILDEIDRHTLSDTQRTAYLDQRAAGLIARGDCRPASARLEEANRIRPTAERFYQLGMCAGRLDQNAAALAHFEEAVRLDPQNIEYLIARGFAYKEARRWSDAANSFEFVLDREPDRLALHEELGYLYARRGRRAEASRWFTRAIDNAPFYPADTPEQRADLARRLYTLRRENLWVSKPVDVTLYSFVRGEAGRFGGTGRVRGPAFGGIEASYRPFWRLPPPIAVQLFGRVTTGVVTSPLDSGDTDRQISAGVRFYPVQSVDLSLSVERGIPRVAGGGWLFRTSYARDQSSRLRPGDNMWPYVVLFGEASLASGNGGVDTMFAETRHGATFNLRNTWLLSPHFIADTRIERGRTSGLYRSFEGGPGVSLKYLFAASEHYTHRSALEMIVHYRGRIERSTMNSQRRAGWSLTTVVTF